jgi:hypothetical protein
MIVATFKHTYNVIRDRNARDYAYWLNINFGRVGQFSVRTFCFLEEVTYVWQICINGILKFAKYIEHANVTANMYNTTKFRAMGKSPRKKNDGYFYCIAI